MSFLTVLILTAAIAGFYFGSRWVSRSPRFSYEPAAQQLAVLIVGVACVLGAGILITLTSGGKKEPEIAAASVAPSVDAEKRKAKIAELEQGYGSRYESLVSEVTTLDRDITSLEGDIEADVFSDQDALYNDAVRFVSNVRGGPANPNPDQLSAYQSAASSLASRNVEIRSRVSRYQRESSSLVSRTEKAYKEARELGAEMSEARQLYTNLETLKRRAAGLASKLSKTTEKQSTIDGVISGAFRAFEAMTPQADPSTRPFG